jgi:hypothetical protein
VGGTPGTGQTVVLTMVLVHVVSVHVVVSVVEPPPGFSRMITLTGSCAATAPADMATSMHAPPINFLVVIDHLSSSWGGNARAGVPGKRL